QQGRRRSARLHCADEIEIHSCATAICGFAKMTPAHEERSAARLAALQALYQLEMTGNAPDDVVQEFLEHRFGPESGHAAPHDQEFFSDIVHGVLRHQMEID